MPDAIWGPGYRVEPFRINRPAVDQALPVRAVVYSPQRILHLPENARIEFRLRDILILRLVGDARVAGIRGISINCSRQDLDVACRSTRKAWQLVQILDALPACALRQRNRRFHQVTKRLDLHRLLMYQRLCSIQDRVGLDDSLSH